MAKTEMEGLGLDTDGMAVSTAKLQKEIEALSGVNIMKNSTEFKSTYDIMDELAKKWSSLTDIQQASVTELVAGKRQGNIVSALMSNFDIARKATESSAQSSGSAMKENEKYLNSIEGKIQQFKAGYQELATTAINSDFLKGLVDGGKIATETLTKLISTFGLFKPALAGIGIAAFVKNLD